MNKYSKMLPLAVFSLFSLKYLAHGVSDFKDAAFLLVIAGLCAYFEFKHERSDLQNLDIRLKELNSKCDELEKRNEEMRTHIGSMKMAQNYKAMSFKG